MAFKLYFSKIFSARPLAILKSAMVRNLVLFTLGFALTFQNNYVKSKVGDITALSVSSLKPLYSSSVASNDSDFINSDGPSVEIVDERHHKFLPQKLRCLARALA